MFPEYCNVFLYPCIIIFTHNYGSNANHSVDDVIGIELDDSPDESDSEKPDSICNKKGFNVKRK